MSIIEKILMKFIVQDLKVKFKLLKKCILKLIKFFK